MCPLVSKFCRNAQHLLLFFNMHCLDHKEHQVMETNSGLDGGNYCVVYIIISYQILYIPLPDNLLLAFCCKYEMAGLRLLFHPYRSSHRSSSAKTSLTKPKYVTICTIRSGWFTSSPAFIFCVWLFAITVLCLESAGCYWKHTQHCS